MADNVIDLTVSSDDETPEIRERRKQKRERQLERQRQSIARLRLEQLPQASEAAHPPPAIPNVPTVDEAMTVVPTVAQARPIAQYLEPKASESVVPMASEARTISRSSEGKSRTSNSVELHGAPVVKSRKPTAKARHGTPTESQEEVFEPRSDRKMAPGQQVDALGDCAGDGRGATGGVEETVSFDWVGIRQRARQCRRLIESAACDSDTEEKENEIGASSPGEEKSSALDIGGIMRLAKSCWVTTTSNGISSREWRAPKSWKIPEEMKTTKIKYSKKKVTAAAQHVMKLRIHHAPPAAPPQFIDAQLPPDVINLRATFNPFSVKYTHAMPFSGVCDCPAPCRHGMCPNGILRFICTVDCCKYEGKCTNGLLQHEGLQLVKKARSAEFTVIATETIDAGVVLGEYLGEIIPVEKPKNKKNAVEPQNGYVYKLKRKSESHPNYNIYTDAKRMGGITRFMNHSCTAPAVFEEVRNGGVHTVVAVTTREVKQGEEVTVNYGDSLWFTCKCGGPSCQHRHLQ